MALSSRALKESSVRYWHHGIWPRWWWDTLMLSIAVDKQHMIGPLFALSLIMILLWLLVKEDQPMPLLGMLIMPVCQEWHAVCVELTDWCPFYCLVVVTCHRSVCWWCEQLQWVRCWLWRDMVWTLQKWKGELCQASSRLPASMVEVVARIAWPIIL